MVVHLALQRIVLCLKVHFFQYEDPLRSKSGDVLVGFHQTVYKTKHPSIVLQKALFDNDLKKVFSLQEMGMAFTIVEKPPNNGFVRKEAY